jgi:cytochrome c nitrite reductase small subunit
MILKQLRRRIGWAGLAMCSLLGIFLGSGAFTFHAGQGGSYFSNDPQACLNCHIMREPYASWQSSSHQAAATCNDCHLSQHPVGTWVSKADNGFRHSWAFTFQNFHEPIELHPRGETILQNNCLRCHGEFVSEAAHHALLDGERTNCIRCHNQVGHALHR